MFLSHPCFFSLPSSLSKRDEKMSLGEGNKVNTMIFSGDENPNPGLPAPPHLCKGSIWRRLVNSPFRNPWEGRTEGRDMCPLL